LLADDFVEHEETPGLAPTKEGVMAFFRANRAAFPDMRMDAQDVFASGDKVTARVRLTGTHQGPFMGMPATGKQVDIQLIDIMRLGDDGLCHEHWGVLDALAMMQQLLECTRPNAEIELKIELFSKGQKGLRLQMSILRAEYAFSQPFQAWRRD